MSHGSSMKQFRCPNGLRVWGSPRSGREISFIFQEIFEDRCYERHGVAIGDGDVVLDIGANVGMFALSLMERFDDLKIVCLEPAALTRDCLERNVAESRWRDHHQVTVLADAVGSENAEAMITYFPNVPGNSTLFPAEKRLEWKRMLEDMSPLQAQRIHKGLALLPRWLVALVVKPLLRTAVTQPCKVRTVSDVIAQLDLARVDLLKIDIEGAEMEALHGIAEPDWQRIRQLAMEVSPGRKGSLDKLIEQLRARGFEKVTTESFTGDSVISVDDPTPCMLYALRQTRG
jgi:FkbM family methyltransferase